MNHAVIRPFEGLSDQEVLEGLAQFPQTGTTPLSLEQPVNCPREIYDLMRECWNPDETKRPSFNEICMFLSRKNMGYKPSDDYVDDGVSVLEPYETALENGFPFSKEVNEGKGENEEEDFEEDGNVMDVNGVVNEGGGGDNIEKSSSKRSVLV